MSFSYQDPAAVRHIHSSFGISTYPQSGNGDFRGRLFRMSLRYAFPSVSVGFTGRFTLTVALALTSPVLPGTDAAEVPPESMDQIDKDFDDGNFNDAFTGYRRLLREGDVDGPKAPHALERAVQALIRLNRVAEVDALLDEATQRYAGNFRLLDTAATQFMQIPRYGYQITGNFERGQHRGGGNLVNSLARDRVRAINLRETAIELAVAVNEHRWAGDAYRRLASDLLYGRGYQEAWRLQILTDLGTLPDYEPGGEYVFWSRGQRGAPVDEQGSPIVYHVPESWEAATNDGQRWRWALTQAAEMDSGLQPTVRLEFARFLESQFGVQTIQEQFRPFGGFGGGFRPDDAEHQDHEETPQDSGVYAVHTLGLDETIARLATGVKRFQLPDEFNHLRVYREIADGPKSEPSRQALESLAGIFENRRQYPRAADVWRELIARYGERKEYAARLAQIVDSWGRFESSLTQPAGKGATIDFRFRNGEQVEFTAREIRVDLLLNDLKSYLRSRRGQIDWQKVQINNIGYRLVHENEEKYVGREVARWSLDLDPREDHFDRRITVTTPLQKGGAYLLTARMKQGNVCKIVVWLADLAIVKKPLEGAAWYFVADAASGEPVARANVEFFGYRQERLRGRQFVVRTRNYAEYTDRHGVVTLPSVGTEKDPNHEYNWLITARTRDRRLAFLGYTNVWQAEYQDQLPEDTKTYSITDRPVYRPEQPVHFKFWVREARYDLGDVSRYAGRSFAVEIVSPRDEKVVATQLTADDYGGFDSTWEIPAEATLGVYQLRVDQRTVGSFRIEEYKKPEFEVSIDAPQEPVALGEKITATIHANYYFGGAVTSGNVKYKVRRTAYSQDWYPRGEWDWLYGAGYWWFAPDRPWYRGWSQWGVACPAPWWIWRQSDPPELVAEAEVPIGPDGTVAIEIDTSFAKAVHGDTDHRYEIVAEVTDESRRTIVGTGQVLAAIRPFKVFTWVDRGYYRAGDTVEATCQARTLDGKPVTGNGELTLFRVRYEDDEPRETAVETWSVDPDPQGRATQKFVVPEAGQYRLACKVTDPQGRSEVGGYLFTVRGDNFDGNGFQFNALELVPDRREYRPGEQVELQVNCNRAGATVMLFARPSNGVYQKPQPIALQGKSTVVSLEVTDRDMPNFFVEAFVVHGGQVHTVVREIYVPPERRVLNVEVVPSAEAYLPGEEASVQLQVTDLEGRPVVGSIVAAIYDKSVEYIAGGINTTDIREFFWSWRRNHSTNQETNLDRGSGNLVPPGQVAMQDLGAFGGTVADQRQMQPRTAMAMQARGGGGGGGAGYFGGDAMAPAAEMAVDEAEAPGASAGEPQPQLVAANIRQEFADTALWIAALEMDSDGMANINLKMPENLTTWKIRVWGMDHGTRVGQGEAEVITRKNLIVRMQAPRFFVENDVVVLSANVHNYLPTDKQVTVSLEMDGSSLELLPAEQGGAKATQTVEIAAAGEARVDWKVVARHEGEATIRMIAQTDIESDGMQMEFPVNVHGMLRTESFTGVLRPDEQLQKFEFDVPAERRVEDTRLEIRYSPTLAGGMVDALPYLIDYPYGCTEQTLNRFLPAVITQRVLQQMGLDLAAIRDKQTNLNPQELGDPAQRRTGWKRFAANPVFSEEELSKIVKAGLERLNEMQLGDGGWGWFSGYGERSSAHTTAVVVHGLQLAIENDVAVVPDTLDRGVAWLKAYQARELAKLRNVDAQGNVIDDTKPAKTSADNTDALVYMVLVDAEQPSEAMLELLYRDRLRLAVYSLATFGLGLLHEGGHEEQLQMVLENISQYVQQDEENQTAWLNLPGGMWWYWYGSEYEAHAYYLKLLVATDPGSEVAARMVKYLLNNRKHATYWNSTRDTALVVEAMADYLRATNELRPDQVVEVWVDGEKLKEVAIDAKNLFVFDAGLVLEGAAVASGRHQVEIRRRGTGPVYFNAYLTNFTLVDHIERAGLELKVNRRYYRLVPEDKAIEVSGAGSGGGPAGGEIPS